MKELEDALGLHEDLEINYMVTHYSAVLMTQDGVKEVARGDGDSILEALQDLNNTLKEKSLKQGKK
ncbi:hypothetical protein C4577_06470 [Candidatus Parcubacteria bacterium]|nr:MAG: hypothetical protein C4577_06470 [Candidatus Parcubacteria bacterium]